ncbi:MAG TPA: hypothetical protein VFD29_09075 [Gillisia sp.]|nr:hypothetical protein [Gillisia sp.]
MNILSETEDLHYFMILMLKNQSYNDKTTAKQALASLKSKLVFKN